MDMEKSGHMIDKLLHYEPMLDSLFLELPERIKIEKSLAHVILGNGEKRQLNPVGAYAQKLGRATDIAYLTMTPFFNELNNLSIWMHMQVPDASAYGKAAKDWLSYEHMSSVALGGAVTGVAMALANMVPDIAANVPVLNMGLAGCVTFGVSSIANFIARKNVNRLLFDATKGAYAHNLGEYVSDLTDCFAPGERYTRKHDDIIGRLACESINSIEQFYFALDESLEHLALDNIGPCKNENEVMLSLNDLLIDLHIFKSSYADIIRSIKRSRKPPISMKRGSFKRLIGNRVSMLDMDSGEYDLLCIQEMLARNEDSGMPIISSS